MNKNTRIYIAGHNGMVGSAVLRKLQSSGYKNLMYKTSKELDLRDSNKVLDFFHRNKPEIVINAAAMVGGISFNESHKYEFLINNMRIQNNLIEYSFETGVDKFIFLGSSCIYPRHAKQPMIEDDLLSNKLEPTNEGYALAKITGVKLIEFLKEKYAKNYFSLMPTNLYGPGDNYDLSKSHVIPAMISKFHKAKVDQKESVTLWGTGKALREFMHVDDLSSAVEFSLNYDLNESLYNVGSGEEVSIYALANIVKKITEFEGELVWDNTKPDGTPRKLMNSEKFFNTGWRPKIKLEQGLQSTYKHYLNNL